MAVRVLPSASGRLLEIWSYTEEKWDEEQADRYIRELTAAINALPRHPREWRPVRDRVLKGVFYVRHRHHYIFFRRLKQSDVGVISILHENMDIPSRLKDDATSND
jgi:plasmid stabilization system protein ParE